MKGITERAGERLKAALGKAPEEPKQCIRIEVTLARGPVIRFDKERDGDRAFEHDGEKVLVVDKKASDAYADRQLDYVEGKFCFV
jgi:Fe-S cluster assembly iron-binding protein IscA